MKSKIQTLLKLDGLSAEFGKSLSEKATVIVGVFTEVKRRLKHVYEQILRPIVLQINSLIFVEYTKWTKYIRQPFQR